LYKGSNYIIITKGEQRVYDNDFLKFLFQLELVNFKGTPAIVKKFAELIRKEEDRQASL